MAKTILIPTDLRVASLNTLKLALELSKDESVVVILLYSEYLSDSITDLLFYSRHKIIDAKTTDVFKEAVQILKNRFEGKLQNLVIKPFHGNNLNALLNFLEAHEVAEIYIPGHYRLATNQKTFDPIPLIRKCPLPVFEMEWDANKSPSEKEQLNTLFN